MEKITCTRKIEFDAAHRVIGHENKCKFLHGHRYVLEVTFATSELDDIGRVIDFGQIKNTLKSWIDENLDHTTILSMEDKKLGDEIEKITKQKIYYINANPTAENILLHLKDIISTLFKSSQVELHKLKIYETPNCSATIEI
jgi:6-pyruvoyltetrahydropterin/6-carboxytetrahydropterin synthase